jgi:predicted HTH domain antitoxin
MSDVRLDVEVPEEIVQLLGRSKLSGRDRASQVRTALAIHLFLTGEVSLSKAAELIGQDRASLERLLRDLDLPLVSYTREEYLTDLRAMEAFERKTRGQRGR